MLSSNLFLIAIVRKMLHYIEPTLETGFYASAILPLGVNDLVNNKSPSSTDDLVSNLVKIVNKCKYFGVMIFLFLELLLTKDSHTLLLKRLMKKLQICVKRTVQFLLIMETFLAWIYSKMVYTLWNEVNAYQQRILFLY